VEIHNTTVVQVMPEAEAEPEKQDTILLILHQVEILMVMAAQVKRG